MIDNKLSGIFVATVTPMTAAGESVDLGGIGPLQGFLAARGMDGVLPLGTTGEYASLSFAERVAVLNEAAATRGGLKLIAGCGSPALPETLELVALAAKRGAAAALVPPPYYFRTATLEGIECFFTAVLERAELPVILYHIPSLTGIPIDQRMLARLARFPHLWGVKDSGGAMLETTRFLAGKPGRVMLGSDAQMVSGLQNGVQGIISACANVVPELLHAIHAGYLAGEDVGRLQDRLCEVRKALKNYPYLAAIKRWLKLRGIDAGFTRCPITNLSPQDDDAIRQLSVLFAPLKET